MTFNNDKELIVPDIDETILSEYESLFPADAIPKDLANKENYAKVKQGLAVGRKLKSTLENWRKAEKKDALDYGRKVDGHAKGIKARVLAVYDPMHQAKAAHDTAVEIAKREAKEAEEKRIQDIADRIAAVKAAPGANIDSDSDQLSQVIRTINDTVTDCSWAEEFEDKAIEAGEAVLAQLSRMEDKAIELEQAKEIAAKVEADRIAKDKAAREAQQAENDRLARENAVIQKKMDQERKALEAEKAKVAEAQKAIDDEKAKIAAQKAAAEQQVKAAKEQKEKDEAAAKELAERKAKLKAEQDQKRKEAEANKEKTCGDILQAVLMYGPETKAFQAAAPKIAAGLLADIANCHVYGVVLG